MKQSSVKKKEGGSLRSCHDPCYWRIYVNSRRLAHTNYKALPYICKAITSLPELKVDQEGICNGCVQGKNIKNPFSKRDNKVEGVLELIHLDVCGPMPSSSNNGYVYYASFINDYSRKIPRYIWSIQQDQGIKRLDKRTLLQGILRYSSQIIEENIPRRSS